MIIGLLGGSFNPAHDGHVHISLQARKKLGCDHIWWIISPQNPLKSAKSIADYPTRLKIAKKITAGHNFIEICEAEFENQLRYTRETIKFLQRAYPQHQFIWLMGGDNLIQFHRWKEWNSIMHHIPIAVIDRAPYSHPAMRGKMALRYRNFRLPANQLRKLARAPLPCWGQLFIPRHSQSATNLRKTLGEKAFML